MRKYTKKPSTRKFEVHDIVPWSTVRAAELRARDRAARILADRLGVSIHHAVVLARFIGLGDGSH